MNSVVCRRPYVAVTRVVHSVLYLTNPSYFILGLFLGCLRLYLRLASSFLLLFVDNDSHLLLGDILVSPVLLQMLLD